MTSRARNLDNVPFDIFYQIVRGLDCDDYVNLSRVNKAIDSFMRNDLLARKTVESYMSRTKEGRLASSRCISFRAAIGRRFDLKEAIITAQPFAVAHVAYGSAYLYNEGVLCYVYAREIRSLDVHCAERTENILNVYNVLRRTIPRLRTEENLECIQIALLCYSAGILAISVEIAGLGSWLLALDISKKRDKVGRLRLIRKLDSTRRLFVRHNGRYLYYGVQISLGSQELPHWAVKRVDFEKGMTLPSAEDLILSERLMGQDIGHNICFEIFQDHLYAVSNQTCVDEEDQDWTSYYVWYCLSPTDSPSTVSMQKSWRRQHHEGPINDTWTTIALYENEMSGEPMIYECRREWHNGSSDNVRTYYTQALPFPSDVAKYKESERDGNGFRRVYLEPSLLSRPTISASSNQYSDVLPSNILLPSGLPPGKADGDGQIILQPPRKRLRRHVHSEYSDEEGPVQRRDFILAKTRYRTYNAPASAFVDLVNDPSGGYSMVGQADRLRLRINPRKRKWADTESSSDQDDDLDHFVSPGVQMWPAEDDSQQIYDLLCPAQRLRGMEATSDERSIVYSVDSGNGDNRTIILLSFDPQIKLKSMLSSKSDGKSIKNQGEKVSAPGSASSSFRVEPALYLSINRGTWLR